ncbi:hypothetical protein AVEN_215513-1 [Araneus ventricosus]|uniref:Uncharacterized protein n=1 Tax=Araneus ventricosus TaxID=182803 RepID=A0A4Y2BES0_ARAVE|nr:hypothetical protein AVEN_215513-1 [Araneus ventricosus]
MPPWKRRNTGACVKINYGHRKNRVSLQNLGRPLAFQPCSELVSPKHMNAIKSSLDPFIFGLPSQKARLPFRGRRMDQSRRGKKFSTQDCLLAANEFSFYERGSVFAEYQLSEETLRGRAVLWEERVLFFCAFLFLFSSMQLPDLFEYALCASRQP